LVAGGVAGLDPMSVQGPYWQQSAALVLRLKNHLVIIRGSGWFRRVLGRV
jgi:hypothetical protein